MVEEDPGLIELGVARGEEAVPEERDLFLQRAPGGDHAIQTVGSRGVKLAEFRLIHMVATDEVLGHGLWVTGVEQCLDHRLVALRDIGLEVTTSRTKPGAAQQMRHERHLFLMHAPVSFHRQAEVTTSGAYTFFAGSRSDPFFFDLMGFCNNFKFTGSDYFTDKDVFGIVLEVPNTALGEQTKVGMWTRVLWSHHDEWLQVARLGLPLVNILFNASEEKDLFNRTEPAQQKALFMNKFVALLESLGHATGQAQEIAQVFLPDILPYDSSSAQGFFNGRKLTDDVVDIVLNLVTGGKVQTDLVGPHTDYLATFPYLGQPHGR